MVLISYTILSVFLSTDSYTNEIIPTDKKIIIELDFIPDRVKPGDKPITLSEGFLRRLLPELKNPRLMKFEDLGDPYEQEGFIEEGCTFVIRGDFNRDGVADLAFVGKYENAEYPGKNIFITIISIKEKRVIRDFLFPISKERVSLINVIEYKPKIDAIGMFYTLASDDCGYLYWTGKKWQYDACQSVF